MFPFLRVLLTDDIVRFNRRVILLIQKNNSYCFFIFLKKKIQVALQ